MKLISTRFHGIMDYLMGIFLIAMPWLFNFYRDGAGTWVPVVLGIILIIYSLFTNYEMGLVKSISMPGHLRLDMLSGAFLAASPWLFNFNEYVYLPHLWVGIAEVALAVLSDRVPYVKRVKVDHRSPQNI